MKIYRVSLRILNAFTLSNFIQGGINMLITKFVAFICRKLTNSVLGIGLFYGFLTTFSLRPSYLFLFVQDPEQKAAAITGFILGQLVRFMSIYTTPLYRLLWTPHTATVLFAPYVLFYFAIDNWDYTVSRATRTNLVIFLNTFIFQLANQILLPTSTLARLVNVYMFRCNNKMLFVISTFVGWLIGHICFLVVSKKVLDGIGIYLTIRRRKELGAALDRYIYTYLGAKFQVRFSHVQYRVAEFQKSLNSELTKYKKQIYQYLSRSLGQEFEFFIRGIRWIVLEIQYMLLINLRRNTGRFVNIFLFATSLYYLGKLPLVIVTHPLRSVQAPPLTQSLLASQDLEADTYWRSQKQKAQENEYKRPEIIAKKVLIQEKIAHPTWGKDLDEEKDKKRYRVMDNRFVRGFCPFQWTRPVRYLSNQYFFGAVRKATSQYYFNTGRSDGKKRISFTAPPSLSIFQELMKGMISSVERLSFAKLDKNWRSKNKERQKNLNKEFRKRIEALDRGFLFLDILEKRTRVCIDKKNGTYLCLPTRYDPLLRGPSRVRSKHLTDPETAAQAKREQLLAKQKSAEKEENAAKAKSGEKEENAAKAKSGEKEENAAKAKSGENEKVVEPQPESAPLDPQLIEKDHEKRVRRQMRKFHQKVGKALSKKIELNKKGKLKENVKTSMKSRKKKKRRKNSRKKVNVQSKLRQIFALNKIHETLLSGFISESPKYEARMFAILKSKTQKLRAEGKLYYNPLSKFFDSTEEKSRKQKERQLKKQKQEWSYRVGQKMGRVRTRKIVPRWSYVLLHQLPYEMGEPFIIVRGKDDRFDVVSASYKYDLLLSEKTENEIPIDERPCINENHAKEISLKVFEDYRKSEGNPYRKEPVLRSLTHMHPGNHDPSNDQRLKPDDSWWVALTTAREQFWEQDEVKGSATNLRRKNGVVISQIERYPHSPLFLGFLENSIVYSFRILKSRVQNLMYTFGIKKGDRFTRKGFKNKQTKTKRKPKAKREPSRNRLEIDPEQEEFRMLGIESWEELYCGLGIRGMILIWNSFVRKYITLPLAIIAKNIGRILLLQQPEWDEDRKEWENEIYLLCNDEGLLLRDGEISIKNFPEEWWDYGFQIKVLYPLELKPWNTAYTQRQTQKYAFIRATWGLADYPWGPVRTNQPFIFWGPIWKHLVKKSQKVAAAKLEGNTLQVIRSLLNTKIEHHLARVLRNLKESIKWFKESIKEVKEGVLVLKRSILNIIKKNTRVKEIGGAKSSETAQDSINEPSNEKINESLSEISSTASTNSEEKIQNLINRTRTINNEIERITKEKQKRTPGLNNSPNNKKQNNNVELPKNFWKIVKRKNVRFISKCKYFPKIFIEKIYQIYLDILLYIIQIPRIHVRKKKEISNTETNQKRITLRQIVPTFASLPTLSSLSQAYVFYKLSQTLVNDKLRAVLQYRGTSFFLKTPIKDSFERQGILPSELKHKKIQNFGTNPWKNWLRGQSQYNLSKVHWERVGAKIWRNKVNRPPTSEPTNLNKGDASEKNPLFPSKKQDDSEVYSLVRNQKTKFQKNYKYDLLAYNYISSETEKDSKWPLQVNNDLFPEEIRFKIYFNDYILDKTFLDQIYRANTYLHNYLDNTYVDKDYPKDFLDTRFLHKIDSRFLDNFREPRDEPYREADYYKQYLDRVYLRTKSVDNYIDNKVYLDRLVGKTSLDTYLDKVYMSLKKRGKKKPERKYMDFDWKIFEKYIIDFEGSRKYRSFDRKKKYVLKQKMTTKAIKKRTQIIRRKDITTRKDITIRKAITTKEDLYHAKKPWAVEIIRVKDEIKKKIKEIKPANAALQKPWKQKVQHRPARVLKVSNKIGPPSKTTVPTKTGLPKSFRLVRGPGPLETAPDRKPFLAAQKREAKIAKIIATKKAGLIDNILPTWKKSDEVRSDLITARKRFKMWADAVNKIHPASHKNSLLWYEHTEKMLKKFQQLKHRGFLGLTEENTDPILNKTQRRKNATSILGFWRGLNKQTLQAPRANLNEEQEDWFFPEFMLRKKIYQMNSWLSPTKLLLLNFRGKRTKVRKGKGKILREEKAKYRELKAKRLGQEIVDNKDIQKVIRNFYDRAFSKYYLKYHSNSPRLTSFADLKWKYLAYGLNTEKLFDEYMHEQINLNELLKKTKDTVHRKRRLMLYMTMDELAVDRIAAQFSTYGTALDWIENGWLTFHPLLTASLKDLEEFLMYQAINISLVYNSKQQSNQGYGKQKEKDHFDLLVPEIILSSRRRRELRILNSLNYNFKNRKGVNRNPDFCTEKNRKSWGHFLAESKDLDREKNELIKLKLFLWPNFRLEDLACMNRYWFDTNNGSRFSMLRIYMYPRFKIR
uniref:Protein TIC 214 n=1 Tax=Downingia elegans TaxID=104522 RepID=A0A1Z2QTJ8_9ASTR|nr:hypothetical chloroplast RF1 [Downingia elegans]ASA34717.1 hypothetical chloroplast RF1 [Downingia elegans]